MIDRPWLTNPVVTPLGELQLAGFLDDASRIAPDSMRTLGNYALILVVRGDCFYCDECGNSRALVPGDAILVFPEIAHAYGINKRNGKPGRWSQIYFVFNGPQFDLLRKYDVFSPVSPVLRLGAVDFWQRRLKEVLADINPLSVGGPLHAFGKFTQTLIEMVAAAQNAGRPARIGWLDKGLRLLGARSASGWLAPREVACATGMSYDNFRKQFSARTGEPPGAYQKRRRVECACAALYHSKAGLKEIAADLGFCDEFHFSKVFKQVTGATPSAYRKKVRGG
jgi:AraC-like DNA-binding protein